MRINRTAFAAASAATAAALLTFYIRPDTQPIAGTHLIKPTARQPARPDIDPLRYAGNQSALAAGAHRNLFTFNDPIVVRRAAIVPAKLPQQPVVAVVQQATPLDAMPAPPALPYRCIGRFGPDNAPFVALENGEHEVINARAGDVIGGQFIIRSIGVESVTIGFAGFPSTADQRIAIGH
jgi:hypothetical protein